MSTRIVVSRKEIAALQVLNTLRASAQTQLTIHAEFLLKVWTKRQKVTGQEPEGYGTTFLSAELAQDGSHVKITFEWNVGPGTEGVNTTEFPIKWFLDGQWLYESERLWAG